MMLENLLNTKKKLFINYNNHIYKYYIYDFKK